MKASRQLLLVAGAVLVFLAGIGFHKMALAQPQQGSDWVAEQAGKLPPDIHPETLSRAARPKESDFTNPEDKKIFDSVNNRPGSKQLFAKWLGPTGTRLQIPELAENYNQQIGMIHDAMTKNGVDKQYQELSIAVATRETDNRDEFLNHEPDAVKLYGQKIQDIVRTRADTTGLDPKQVAIIQFGRELFGKPKVSSKAFADLEKNFGKKGALSIALIMCYYDSNYDLMRVYDQHMDTSGKCPGPHSGCLDAKNPPPTW
jgi:hypothetical protein